MPVVRFRGLSRRRRPVVLSVCTRCGGRLTPDEALLARRIHTLHPLCSRCRAVEEAEMRRRFADMEAAP